MKKISEILREERIKKGYSLTDIAQITKIKKEFLAAIEEGNFYSLPSEAYAMGFVKNYAEVLGVSPKKSSALFRREFKEEKREIVPEFRKHTRIPYRNSLFTTRNIFISLLFLVFVSYMIFQYSSVFFGPPLTILNPKENGVFGTNVIHVNGKTDPSATVFVNGEEVYVSLDGSFQKSLYLFQGKTKINITAKNRFGKQTTEYRDVVVK